MGQHVTIHGKTTTPSNGATGVWTPVQVNSAGQIQLAPIQGELTTFNRLGSGPVVQYKVITADDNTVTGAAIFYGLKVLTAGTSVTVYDSNTATGTVIMSAEPTTTAGAVLTPAGAGVGVLMTTGIYVDLTLGTYVVYYVSAV